MQNELEFPQWSELVVSVAYDTNGKAKLEKKIKITPPSPERVETSPDFVDRRRAVGLDIILLNQELSTYTISAQCPDQTLWPLFCVPQNVDESITAYAQRFLLWSFTDFSQESPFLLGPWTVGRGGCQ